MELRKSRRQQRSLPATGHNSLMLACQQESKEDVKNILDRQPGVAHQRDPTGKHALHYCAENVSVECASRVLSAGPSLLNAPDDEGYTPLHLAVISGNKSMVKYLLTRGADSSAVDSEKHSCVHWATVSGDCDCLELLIQCGADPCTPDIHGAFPVHYAAQMCGPNSEMGNDVKAGLAVLRKLLAKGVNVACVDRDGRPPLLWAASGGSSDAILALIKAGADVNAVDRDGLTALHCAASRGHADCLETLVSLCGAEVDKTDDGGCSALFYAVTLGHADCTNLLLSYGSKPDRQDNKGRTPAHCGAAKGQMETIKILSQHKANLWLRNAKGDMPLHEAVQSGRKDLVEWLLHNHRGSVNVSNSNGRTPLHIAAITNNVDMCKVLMDYGGFVNPIMRNSKGQHMTPMDAALHRSNRSCAKYLSLHGALPASKLMEKRECNRFTDTQLPETMQLSPNTQRRILRDSSAQTEPRSRDVDVQARVDVKSVAATTTTSDLERRQRDHHPSAETCGGSTQLRCPAQDAKGKPIIARVYVHTKKPRVRRVARKPTAHRREYHGEKLLTRQQQRLNGNVQSTENGASNTVDDTVTPPQTDQSKEIPSRKASQPTIHEEQQPVYDEPQPLRFEVPSRKMSQPTIYEERQPLFDEKQPVRYEIPSRRMSQPTIYKERQPVYEEQQPVLYEIPSRKASQPTIYEEHQPVYDEPQPVLYEIPNPEASQPTIYEERYPIYDEQQPVLYENPQSALYEEIRPVSYDTLQPTEPKKPPEPRKISGRELWKRASKKVLGKKRPGYRDEPLEDTPPDTTQTITETPGPSSPVRENQSQTCDCYETHGAEADCNCDCHETTAKSRKLSLEKRRRSSFMTAYDTENQSPLSSIRSVESTVKDSGFSDDVERSHREAISSSDEGRFSDSETRVKRKKRHVARYIVSSGAAETFRLDEDDEETDSGVVVKPRSSSLPHLKEREGRFETCPRLLNRPTLTKDVQRSLKKYQMERRLFYELQELKRKQITTAPGEEWEVVVKMVERFRNYVLGPTMSDFEGPYTFLSFEKYLYEQLRKLSMGGKIPKPKAGTKNRIYATPLPRKDSTEPHILCTCQTHKCRHRLLRSDSDLTLNRTDNNHIPLFPSIVPKTPASRIPVNRSKSWDRLEDSPRKNSTLATKLSGSIQTSNSLPSLSNPFPRRVPAALLAAISEKLGPSVHPEDTVVVEMSSDNNVNSKMRHAFTVQELREVVTRYEKQAGRKVKPIPLETVLDPDDDGPITFEIRHGKEKNVFRLPAGKLKDNKKWQVTFTIGKWQKDASSIHAK